MRFFKNYALRCYSYKTAITEEQFISLDDPALGKSHPTLLLC